MYVSGNNAMLSICCEGAPAAALLPSRAVPGVAHVGAPAAEGPQPPLQLPGPAGTFSQLPKSLASPPTQPFGIVSSRLARA